MIQKDDKSLLQLHKRCHFIKGAFTLLSIFTGERFEILYHLNGGAGERDIWFGGAGGLEK